MSSHLPAKKRKQARTPRRRTSRLARNPARSYDEAGKLTPAQAEAITSADLPSGDPELTAPATTPEQLEDYVRQGSRKRRAA